MDSRKTLIKETSLKHLRYSYHECQNGNRLLLIVGFTLGQFPLESQEEQANPRGHRIK